MSNDLTQQALAERVGLSRARIQHYEAGRAGSQPTNPSYLKLVVIARTFGITLAELHSGLEEFAAQSGATDDVEIADLDDTNQAGEHYYHTPLMREVLDQTLAVSTWYDRNKLLRELATTVAPGPASRHNPNNGRPFSELIADGQMAMAEEFLGQLVEEDDLEDSPFGIRRRPVVPGP
jgi:transcriptional regulator with XRE-family HTH domain